ncbi:SAM-dependent methyltransferase [Chitinispirillum alkaliphilum]|nr:SAM-dependent methyltransferase [Chitinispirillum alkaliphilum]
MFTKIINMLRKFFNRVYLNLRVLVLIFKNRWLKADDLGQSYNSISPHYDENWLNHLRDVTERLLLNLPDRDLKTIADLGCGTGFTTEIISARYPKARITGIDISKGMIEIARERTGEQVSYCVDDMLNWLRMQESEKFDLVVSAWSMGYSYPAKIFREVSRVLKKGGCFLFVVNFSDTLQPVFNVFRSCMRTYPSYVEKIVLPRFPSNGKQVKRMMKGAGLEELFYEEGRHMIKENQTTEPLWSWIVNTGVLAGFDKIMPLREEKVLQNFFEEQLRTNWQPLTHHYVMSSGRKQ